MAETKDNPPLITEPIKWFGYQINKNWHHLIAAPLAFASVAIIACLFQQTSTTR
jgi:hypothetical protein